MRKQNSRMLLINFVNKFEDGKNYA